jgi:metal-responsive CopG/Arc/MetJ family transcriptional regulator
MKEKISITLSPDLLSRLDLLAGSRHSRSGVIEWILRGYFRQSDQSQARARDLKLINKHAKELNSEALDVLEYQRGE